MAGGTLRPSQIRWRLLPSLGPLAWIRSRLAPPKTARNELPSTTARDHSISPQRASQSSKEKWISCQMPASCQSRNRRQQVMPELQPSSCGSISQGIPLRRTNRIPVRQARSGKRGLPTLLKLLTPRRAVEWILPNTIPRRGNAVRVRRRAKKPKIHIQQSRPAALGPLVMPIEDLPLGKTEDFHEFTVCNALLLQHPGPFAQNTEYKFSGAQEALTIR